MSGKLWGRLCLLAWAVTYSTASAQTPTTAGAAKVDITPQHPTVLAGYGGRTGEHDGVDQRIWARALAIGEPPLLVIAVDNCGFPGEMVERVAAQLQRRTQLPRANLAICATHTHSAPSLVGYAPVLWGGRTTAEQDSNTKRYTTWLQDQLVRVGELAIKARRPAQLSWGQGRVEFGGNRRVLRDGAWTGFGFQTDGPVDHSLPVLLATDSAGKTIAVWTNYACHCTTLGGRNRIGGDWAGFANQHIEEHIGDGVAVTTIGCGADVGPQPSGNQAIAQTHGRAIAGEVRRVIKQGLTNLDGQPRAQFKRLKLPLQKPPERAYWERQAKLGGFDGYHAKQQLARLDRGERLAEHVDYPLGAWTFGDDLAIVFLGGEVVVDYAVRLKTELDWRRVWINAWSNAVPSYIPSKRVLAEGGYEAEFSQIYYDLPSQYAAAVEDLIVGNVRDAVGSSFAKRPQTPPPTFLKIPQGRELFQRRVDDWLAALPAADRGQLADLPPLAKVSSEGFQRLRSNDGDVARWYDYSSGMSDRPYIRQLNKGDAIAWTAPPHANPERPRQTFVFAGGLGWESEPKTDGFEFLVNGKSELQFDVTRRRQTWRSESGTVELHYFPTWTSAVDSAGFFHLVVDSAKLTRGKPNQFAVRSLGAESKRWFALDRIPDVRAIENILVEALAKRNNSRR